MIKLIMFDSSGVVLDGGYPKTCKVLAKRFKIPYKKVFDITHNQHFEEACKKVAHSTKSWENSLKQLGVKAAAKKIELLHLNLHKINRPVMEIARKLKNDYLVVLLSNNFQNYIDYLSKRFSYDDVFHEVINSQNIRINKTDPKMFEYVLNKYKLKGEEVLYIDDMVKYLKIAKNLRINGIEYRNLKQLKKTLNRYLKPKVKLIIFDCYGLVLSSGYPDTSKYLAKKYGSPRLRAGVAGGRWQDYQKVMYTKYFNQAAERKITQKQAWQKTIEDFHLPITWQELRDLHYRLFTIDKRVVALNEKLNQQGIKTLLLSKNTRSQFADTCKRFGLKKKFKNVINTWELNLPKASAATLKEIMRRFKVKPKEIVYADDQQNNLTDAKKIGVRTIFVKNFNQFKKELNQYL